MEAGLVRRFHYMILCAVSFLVFFSQWTFGQKNRPDVTKGWKNLNYSIFFTWPDVQKLLVDSVQFKKTVDYFGPIKPIRVYLDGGGQREYVDVEILEKVAGRFRTLGIEADGAMVPTSPHGGPSTYNSEEDLQSLKLRMQAMAEVFDRIILDDWLFTNATDQRSVQERGSKSWAEYRTNLLLRQAKEYIINPAKEINPKLQIIIKYPNWYEGFAENGYDVYRQTHQFDKMAVGIETRIPESQHQHIPIYSGYIFQKWYASVDPSKWVGSWLDNYEMRGASDDYIAQVWQAIFARSPEIILWCAGQLWPSNRSSDVFMDFVKKLDQFDKVAGLLKGQPRGIPIYLPYGSVGEYNIFGYLGMIGIPLEPVAVFPKEAKGAIFCLNSLQDTSLANEMIERLQNGKDVFMTFELWNMLKNTEFRDVLSLLPYHGEVSSSKFGLLEGWFQERTVDANRKYTFPGIEATTWPETRDVTLSREDYDFSVLMKIRYLNGTIYILNMPSNSYDLLELPTPVLNAIRRSFVGETGEELDGPGHIAMYLFGENQYVLFNTNHISSTVSLKFNRKLSLEGWRELLSGQRLSAKQDSSYVRFGEPVFTTVTLEMKPSQIAIVETPQP